MVHTHMCMLHKATSAAPPPPPPHTHIILPNSYYIILWQFKAYMIQSLKDKSVISVCNKSNTVQRIYQKLN